MSKMKGNKVTGPDGIPVEVYKHCSEAKETLFKFLVPAIRREAARRLCTSKVCDVAKK